MFSPQGLKRPICTPTRSWPSTSANRPTSSARSSCARHAHDRAVRHQVLFRAHAGLDLEHLRAGSPAESAQTCRDAQPPGSLPHLGLRGDSGLSPVFDHHLRLQAALDGGCTIADPRHRQRQDGAAHPWQSRSRSLRAIATGFAGAATCAVVDTSIAAVGVSIATATRYREG
jgi:hypothetical protein